jgi:hypothetical protein
MGRYQIMAVNDLTFDEITKALPRINGWRLDPDSAVVCPRCEAPGLVIIDQSARPYAEWYALSCAACGMAASLHIPLAGPSASS